MLKIIVSKNKKTNNIVSILEKIQSSAIKLSVDTGELLSVIKNTQTNNLEMEKNDKNK